MTTLRAIFCFLALLAISMPGPSVAASQEVYPILAGDFLLGGSQAGTWIDAATTAARLRGGERYRLYRLYRFRRALGSAIGSKPKTIEGVAHCDTPQRITLSPAPDIPDVIAVAGRWNALPRVPQVLSPKSQVYRQAVADLLRAHGITQPAVSITRIIRIDLEGDGVDEVLINASHHAQGFARIEAGDYSLVVLRKAIKGKVVTLPLAATYFTQAEPTPQNAVENDLQAVLDLNGDGWLEPIVATGYFEGSMTRVYSVRGVQVSVVLQNGCGV